jgi:hypothetical protein
MDELEQTNDSRIARESALRISTDQRSVQMGVRGCITFFTTGPTNLFVNATQELAINHLYASRCGIKLVFFL